MMKFGFVLCLTLVAIVRADVKPVTCGSAIKLTHTEAGGHHYLSSEDKNLGSGSGQQIVTWVPASQKSSISTLWWLRESNDADKTCQPGTAIRCGETIRLTHLETKRNLHSHAIHHHCRDNKKYRDMGMMVKVIRPMIGSLNAQEKDCG
ncbi:protein O-mannosyltransferase [Fragilaria crotonensis]|nr:protein O-mannosyltransferase [Fragilaria crotonensis]